MTVATSVMAQTDNHGFETMKQLDVFNAIYRNLDMVYVDTLDAKTVIGNGINAMLRSLDPYTEYYSVEDQTKMEEMLSGKYAGIGAVISYSFTRHRVMINEPYKGMPAAVAGLQKGDIILSIDGEDMRSQTSSYVSSHLRGEPGTMMKLKIERPSTGKELSFDIVRQTIQLPYLPYYGLYSTTGYINLNQFVENAARDVRRAFVSLKNQGATSMILDLRNNGGGSVSEARDILSMFLHKGDTLLTMRGKLSQSNKTYVSEHEPIDTVMPIVVLVDEGTASASEITAGALQDYDRALILGKRTYGKGLVQASGINVPYSGQMKITTAKYFIPSGRCIQARSYDTSRGGYTERVPDSLTHVFHTKAGREVRDGGGIKPDIEVELDSVPNIAYYLERVDTTDLLLNYEIDYLAKHPQIDSARVFSLSDSDYEDFAQRVISSGFTYDRISEKYLKELREVAQFEGYLDDTRELFDSLEQKLSHNLDRDLHYSTNKEAIKRIIESDIIAAHYFQAGQIEHSLRSDNQFAEALRILQTTGEYTKQLNGETKEQSK